MVLFSLTQNLLKGPGKVYNYFWRVCPQHPKTNGPWKKISLSIFFFFRTKMKEKDRLTPPQSQVLLESSWCVALVIIKEGMNDSLVVYGIYTILDFDREESNKTNEISNLFSIQCNDTTIHKYKI